MLGVKDKAILIYHDDKDGVIIVNKSIEVYNKLKNISVKNIKLRIVVDDNIF